MTTTETSDDLRKIIAEGMSDIAKALKAERQARKWTQQDVGDELGCSPTMVSGWETGQHMPAIERLEAWAALFDCRFALIATPRTGPDA